MQNGVQGDSETSHNAYYVESEVTQPRIRPDAALLLQICIPFRTNPYPFLQ